MNFWKQGRKSLFLTLMSKKNEKFSEAGGVTPIFSSNFSKQGAWHPTPPIYATDVEQF